MVPCIIYSVRKILEDSLSYFFSLLTFEDITKGTPRSHHTKYTLLCINDFIPSLEGLSSIRLECRNGFCVRQLGVAF